MRARNIKPGFFKNEGLAALPYSSRLLFIALWCLADREGRLEKRPLRIKAEAFPYDSLDINRELTVIERLGFIQSYVVDGKEYIQVTNFLKHQRPHHTEAQSKLPVITEENKITVNSRLSNGEYPPDSLIHRFSDSLIQNPSTTAADQIENVLAEKQERLRQLFPDNDIAVVGEKLLNHYKDKPKLIDPWDITLKWFQKEFPAAKQVISLGTKMTQREIDRQNILEQNKQACRDFAGV